MWLPSHNADNEKNEKIPGRIKTLQTGQGSIWKVLLWIEITTFAKGLNGSRKSYGGWKSDIVH